MSNVPPPGSPPGPPPGQPPSAPLTPMSGVPAGIGPRFVARLIDGLILVGMIVPVFILAFILGQISSALGVIVAVLGYVTVIGAGFYILGWGLGETGQTPGKRMQGVKVVNQATGQPIGGGMGIGRYFLEGIVNVACYIGWIWALFDDRNQTLSDKILTAEVIETPPGSIMPIFPDEKPF